MGTYIIKLGVEAFTRAVAQEPVRKPIPTSQIMQTANRNLPSLPIRLTFRVAPIIKKYETKPTSFVALIAFGLRVGRLPAESRDSAQAFYLGPPPEPFVN